VPRSLAAVLVVCALSATAGCGGSTSSEPATTTSAATVTEAPATTAPARTQTQTSSSQPQLLRPSTLRATAPATYSVVFRTTKGPFTVLVHRNLAPNGADRFYNLVKNRFYNGVRFFRVVPGFVVQFGIHPNPQIAQAWQQANITDDPVAASNKRGTVTFATAGPNTRTTQVFINLADNASLDQQGFAPFGTVVDGMATIAKLYSGYGEQPTQAQGQMTAQGDAFLRQNFPKLDRIITARIAK
jgi:peptidyl-prolyl cis-trans isomerase A (cyclophilin A)